MFITLTEDTGKQMRVNIRHIITYEKSVSNGTFMTIIDDGVLYLRNTIEQVDKLIDEQVLAAARV